MRKRTFLLFLLIFPLCVSAQPYLEQNLVAFWPFNGNANDYSGNNFNGTAYGVFSVNDHNSQPNHAYYFDGIASKVSVPHDRFITEFLTVSFYIKIVELNTFNFAMACSDFAIFTENDTVGIMITTISQKMARAYCEINKWTHVVGTYDDNDIRLYINGVLADSVYHPGLIQDVNWTMVMGGFGSNYWKGELDEIRIYERVLSDAEIGQLHDYYGIREQDAGVSISVWPQPATTVLNFSYPGDEIPAMIIYSVDGRVYNCPKEWSAGGGRIDVSSLASGIYIMELRTDGYRYSQKIIIE